VKTPTRHVDCLVIGAGIAGLWTRVSLERAGYSVLTLERSGAGDGQSIASQGILHRGLKYQLSPAAAKAASELGAASKVWDDCLAGRGEIDLRGVQTLAERMHMWAPPGGVGGLLAKVTAGMATLTMTSAAERLDASRWPRCLEGADPATAVYEVVERCVDVASLLGVMLHAGRTPLARGVAVSIAADAHGATVVLADGESVRASCVVACAGGGNAEIAGMVGLRAESVMQTRPLKMVAMRGAPFELNGHCIQPMSDKPRLTVTTTGGEGDRYWWLGGGLAEDGVSRTDAEQVAAARDAVRACVPWADLKQASFSVYSIDRAEGRTAEGKRPDGPVVLEHGRVLLAWPTKLALAPTLATEVVRRVAEMGVARSGVNAGEVACGVAQSPWLAGGVRWS